MNAEVDKSQADEQQARPKSKRLSSLIWIGVLWGGIRLVAELDHISWRRSFSSDAVIFGLWPATFFLALSFLFPRHTYTSLLRWSAFLSTVGSFSSLFFFSNQRDGMDFIVIGQRVFIFVVISAIAIHWFARRRNHV